METAIATIPANHQFAIGQMHLHAAGLMKAKYEHPRISQLTPEQVVVQVRGAIQDCFKSLGHWDSSKDTEVLEYQTKEMIRYFLSEFKNLTIPEFSIILRNMVKGDYRHKKEDMITCSVQSMCQAIKSYLASPEYKMAFTDYQTRLKLNEGRKPEPTPAEIENILKTGCIKAYGAFLTDGSLPVAVTAIYDYLKKAKQITWTETEKQAITRQAEKMYKQRQQEGGIKVKESEDGLKVEKKRAALHAYFHRCKNKGMKEIF